MSKCKGIKTIKAVGHTTTRRFLYFCIFQNIFSYRDFIVLTIFAAALHQSQSLDVPLPQSCRDTLITTVGLYDNM